MTTEPARVAYLAGRLTDALSRPLTAPGSEAIIQTALKCFPEPDRVMFGFAEKALETLRDGEPHNRISISTEAPHAAVSFIAWNGTHREVQSQRFGRYLGSLFDAASRLVQRGFTLAGFLEFDAYVRETVDPSDPARPLNEVFEVDVEFSFLPGNLLGYPEAEPNPLPRMLLLNPDLCTSEEIQRLNLPSA